VLLVQIPDLMLVDLLLSCWAAQACYLDFCSRFVSRASMLAGELYLPGHVMAPKGITTCSQHTMDVAEQHASVTSPMPAVTTGLQQNCKQLSMQHSKSPPPAVDDKQC